jgi:hypothetical protein
VVAVAILLVVEREEGRTFGYRESLSDSCGAVKLGSGGGVGCREEYVVMGFVTGGLGVGSFFGAGGDFFQKRMKLVFFLTIGSGGTSGSDFVGSWRSDLERKIRPLRVNGGRCWAGSLVGMGVSSGVGGSSITGSVGLLRETVTS